MSHGEEVGTPKSFRELARDMRKGAAMSESLVDKWEKWCDKIGYDCQNAYDAAMIDARRDDARELKVRDAEIRTLGDRDATKAFDMILALLDGQPEEGKRG